MMCVLSMCGIQTNLLINMLFCPSELNIFLNKNKNFHAFWFISFKRAMNAAKKTFVCNCQFEQIFEIFGVLLIQWLKLVACVQHAVLCTQLNKQLFICIGCDGLNGAHFIFEIPFYFHMNDEINALFCFSLILYFEVYFILNSMDVNQ